jgi:hypothetical protein
MQERFNRAVYGDHPAAITSPTSRRSTRLRRPCSPSGMPPYVPENAILGIAGDVPPRK